MSTISNRTQEATEKIIYWHRTQNKEITNRRLQLLLYLVNKRNDNIIEEDFKDGVLFPLLQGIYMEYCVYSGYNLANVVNDLKTNGYLKSGELNTIYNVCKENEDKSFFTILMEIKNSEKQQ